MNSEKKIEKELIDLNTGFTQILEKQKEILDKVMSIREDMNTCFININERLKVVDKKLKSLRCKND